MKLSYLVKYQDNEPTTPLAWDARENKAQALPYYFVW